ncbi:MAG: WD40 repeat domain-containing protein [Myxococcales bacterium]|nr:WD40 repeat domain-containing protein [Myxococcales bacterium]
MRRASFVFMICVLLSPPIIGGCGGYSFFPVSQCGKDMDCLANQFCSQGTCKDRPAKGTGTIGVPCKESADCLSEFSCQEDTCKPRTTEPITHEPNPDGGPQTEELPPEKEPEALPEVIPSPPTECVPNTVRFCCGPTPNGLGQKQCSFDKTWGPCTPPQNVMRRWVLFGEHEACDEIDNDCDGYTDEGCPPRRDNACGAFYHIPYGPPAHHIAFAKIGPDEPYVERGGYAFNAKRQVAVYQDAAKQGISLARLRFAEKKDDPRGPTYEWLLKLPVPNVLFSSSSFNEQGSLLITYTSGTLYFWELLYTADGTLYLGKVGKFAMQKRVYGVHFVGPTEYVVFQGDSNQPKATVSEISRWKLDLSQNSEIQTQQIKTSSVNIEYANSWHGNPSYAPHLGLFAIGNDKKAYLVDAQTLQVRKELELQATSTPETRTILFHPTKPRLVVAPVASANIYAFDVTPDAQGNPVGNKLDLYQGPQDSIGEIWGFHPQTGELYARTNRGIFRWKEPTDGQPSQAEFVISGATAYALHEPSGIAVVAHYRGWWSIVSIKDGKPLGRVQTSTAPNEANFVQMAKFADDGTLAFMYRDRLEVWKLQQKTDGSATLTKVQDIASFKIQPDWKLALDLSKDGRTLVWSAKTKIEVWKRGSGDQFSKTAVFDEHTKNIQALAIHKSGQYMLSGAEDNQLRIWSLETPLVNTTLKSFAAPVVGVGFYEKPGEGEFILGTSQDGKSYAWSITPMQSGLPQTTELEGELNGSFAGLEATKVLYPQGANYLFLLVGKGNYTEKVLKQEFSISSSTTNGGFKISEVGTYLDFELSESVQSTHFSPQASTPKTSFLYGFTQEALRVWKCTF